MIKLKQNGNESCCELRDFCEIDFHPDAGEPVIEYYDDEELDVFRNYSPEAYSAEEIEQFREVLYTLLETDVAGWFHSLHLRGIELPVALRDEAVSILSGK
jgi:hypothetical protein